MAIVNKFNVNNKQVRLDADIIENMSANDVSYNSSLQYDKNTVGDKFSDLESEIDVFKETVTEQVNNYAPIVINGNVTNASDEEDLTSVDGLLKFKNRSALNGMGYVILRKDKSFTEQVTQANTIYEIRYDFDLNGEKITIPKDCVLEFEGGKLKNGILVGNNTIIVNKLNQCFEDSLVLSGTFVGPAYPEWYGCYANQKSVCAAKVLNKLYQAFDVVKLQIGKYYILSQEPIKVKSIYGFGKGVSILINEDCQEGYFAMYLGKIGGTPYERTWHRTIDGITIQLFSKKEVYKTACFVLGATTRCVINNVMFWNYIKRTKEFTKQELENVENFTNYALIVNGASELCTITNFAMSADIVVFHKTPADLLTYDTGVFESSEFGFGTFYGYPIGSNSSIYNCDLALGLYGLHFSSQMADSGRFFINNIRIEQLRTLTIDDIVYGANIKINASSLTPSTICNSGFSGGNNGIHLIGWTSLYLENCYTGSGTTRYPNNYCIKLEEDFNGIINCRNCNLQFNAPMIISDNIYVTGFKTGQIYGNGYEGNLISNMKAYRKKEPSLSDNFECVSLNKYQKEFEYNTESGYNLLLAFNISTKQINKINYALITFETTNDEYSKSTFVVRFDYTEGNQDRKTIISTNQIENIGKDLFSLTYESDKIQFYADINNPNNNFLCIYNNTTSYRKLKVICSLITSGILDNYK